MAQTITMRGLQMKQKGIKEQVIWLCSIKKGWRFKGYPRKLKKKLDKEYNG